MTGEAAQVVYQAEPGMIDSQILFRSNEVELGIDPSYCGGGEGDGDLLRLLEMPTLSRATDVIDELGGDTPGGACLSACSDTSKYLRGLMLLRVQHTTYSRSWWPWTIGLSRAGLRVCRKTISQHQFSTATTDFFLFSVDRWLYLPAEGSISALFREFVS
ncbi:MAG: hypothetical protein NTV57_04375, partial [Cyanobacteria bacterium]|nr:hypothetical protein [Cyanobacteriota bacterium]